MKKHVFITILAFICIISLFFTPLSVLAAEKPVNAALPNVISQTAVLMDADSGQVIYQKDMDKRMYPASITKIMTGMLALENNNLSDTITMSEKAVFSVGRDTSHIALTTDEQITLEQALYALSMASANDAANGIAELVAGSLEGFAALMNEKAFSLGALNTNFANAHGLPDDNHYTTAYDMALITKAAIQVPGFNEIFGAKRYSIPPTNKQPDERLFSARNALLNGEVPYPGILMSKTGWTSLANHTLVTVASQNGRTLIAVVMNSPVASNKWVDTAALFDYGFERFQSVGLPDNFFQNIDTSRAGGSAANMEFVPEVPVSVLLPLDKTTDDIVVEVNVENTSEVNKQDVSIVACLQLQSNGLTTEITDVQLKPVPIMNADPIINPDPITPKAVGPQIDSDGKSQRSWVPFVAIPSLIVLMGIFARIFYIGQRKRIRQRQLSRSYNRGRRRTRRM